MKSALVFPLVFATCFMSLAQGRLEGLWDGTITFGGLHSSKRYKFQLWIQSTGKSIKGRSYIYLTDKNVIEMGISGRLFDDLSLALQDVEHIPLEGSTTVPPFYRKYQIIFRRTLSESTLDGYWQQILDHNPMDENRQLGRIQLKKIPTAMKP